MLPIPLNEHGQQKRLDAPRKNEARRVDVSLSTVRRGEGAAETFGRDAHSRDHRRGEQRRGDRLHRQVRRLLPGRPCWHHPTRRVNRSMLEKMKKNRRHSSSPANLCISRAPSPLLGGTQRRAADRRRARTRASRGCANDSTPRGGGPPLVCVSPRRIATWHLGRREMRQRRGNHASSSRSIGRPTQCRG